jgi:VanZ family protein
MLLLVAGASLLPARELPPAPFSGVDKLEHLLAYALLSAYAVMLFATRRAQLAAALALVAFGVAIEGLQATLTASRSADALDVLANAGGVTLGQLVRSTRLARLLERIDGQRP